ncbi:proteasome core particle subunit beta 2 [Sporobolomyces koalae]|uniref:proteasome core particle subunit beta 2 n=1 Tax=Sporobolomyces koalae TaxID=500713 RepID=UPI00317491F8
MHAVPAGFSFENTLRNSSLASKNLGLPKATSTGTTIVGCLYDNGIVLGADTRATEGPIVADKNCEKIHFISEHIRCCGAGTAADTELQVSSPCFGTCVIASLDTASYLLLLAHSTTNMISSNMALHQLSTGRPPLVSTAMTMLKQYLFQYQGQVGAALVLGGIDPTGPHLYTVAPHGSTDKLPYVTMGSGSLAAMATFESKWVPNLSRQQAIDLVCEAIEAGIWNDLGSGSNVDVCVIEGERDPETGKWSRAGQAKTDMLRNYKTPNEKVHKERNYKWRRGVTAWTKEEITKLVVSEEVVPLAAAPQGQLAMEVDA